MIILQAAGSHAGVCDNPLSSEDVARCLGIELRESDAKINEIYKALMEKLSDSDRARLRQAQRAWIKERDSACELDSKESNREKWYQNLLKDYVKTVCVTRYTRQRTMELERMASDIASKSQKNKASVPAQSFPKPADYKLWAAGSPSSGLWYFEVTVDVGAIAGFSPSALWMGCFDRKAKHAYGTLFQIRACDTDGPLVRMGYALDLASGKLYLRSDGKWVYGAPGSSGGMDLKLGTIYGCGIETTALIAPLIDKGYLQPNFGEKQFTYAVPDGYRPLAEANTLNRK
ncbi:MAG: lysozyme inhibitor LprI family protein [Thermodesulfovibrionales bacterium]|nr:lysozyme inhibitor LprI family protein [Thermodesulfovibrionales bacterium]